VQGGWGALTAYFVRGSLTAGHSAYFVRGSLTVD
jgi:hypothetical protein